MKSPPCASAIADEWVEYVIQQYVSRTAPDTVIRLKDFSFTAVASLGDGFNAELIGVDATCSIDGPGDSSSPDDKKFNLLAKFLVQESFSRKMIKTLGYHIKEFTMYSIVVPELNRFWEENSSNKSIDSSLCLPTYLFGVCQPGEYVLVMENCKSAGFETNDKRTGLDVDQLMLAVGPLARMHALSYAYDQKYNFLEKFPVFEFNPLISRIVGSFVLVSLENTMKFVRSLDGGRREILEKLERGKQNVPLLLDNMWNDQSRHAMLCLTHGDFWNNNLMFKYKPIHSSELRSVEEVKVIDWQIAQWNNPVFDLHYILNTTTTSKLRHEHCDDILRHYHTTFMNVADSLRCSVPNWSYEHFLDEFNKTSSMGFLMGMSQLLGTLNEAVEKHNPSANCTTNIRTSRGRVFLDTIKTAAAHVIVPLMTKPSSQFLITSLMRKMLSPIGQELVEGSNTIMNERLLDLLEDADRRGLLDALSLTSN